MALLLIAAGVVGWPFAVRAQGRPPVPLGGRPGAATVKNPAPQTSESVAAGRAVYQRMCLRCHGPNAKGDGGGAGAGGQPADLTDEVWDYGNSDGDIFAVISDGTSPDMEGYAGRLRDADIWNIINFLRSIGPRGKQP